MSSKNEVEKSNYGPRDASAYNPIDNIKRKAANIRDVAPVGPNQNVKSYSSKPGQLSAKQQAVKENSKRRVKKLSGPVKVFSAAEISQMGSNPTAIVSKDEMLEVAPDGKQEIVEGKEPLKKDPKSRWNALKKALDHDKAFMDLDDAMGDDQQSQEGQPSAGPNQSEGGDVQGDLAQELAPEQDGQETPSEEPQGEEAQQDEGSEEAGPTGDQGEEPPDESADSEQDSDSQVSPDQQELIDALKEDGHSDAEIAYIVHGHHSPEVDVSKQAKAQATQAMSEHDLDAAGKMAEIERQHTLASMEHERSHKQRMSDLEYDDAQNKKNETGIQQAHKQRMLDLEYERAKRESETPEDDGGDAEANREIKRLEVEKKKLELKLHEQEMKLELEFKQREHELKLKMMEQQLKEQAKQKSEISGVKHKQKLSETKNPPAASKKSLKKNEEYDEQD